MGAGLERSAPVRRERLRHAAEGSEQRRLVVRLGDLPAHVRNGPLDRASRLRHARADAAAHVLRLARVVGGQCLEPRDPGVRRRFVVERRVERGVVRRRVEAVAADEGHALFVEGEASEREVDAVEQQLAVELRLRRPGPWRAGLAAGAETPEYAALRAATCLRRIVGPDARRLRSPRWAARTGSCARLNASKSLTIAAMLSAPVARVAAWAGWNVMNNPTMKANRIRCMRPPETGERQPAAAVRGAAMDSSSSASSPRKPPLWCAHRRAYSPPCSSSAR